MSVKKTLAKVVSVFAMAVLLGADASPPPAGTTMLPGQIVNAPHAPVTITGCHGGIDHRKLRPSGAFEVTSFAAYRNDSAKPVDEVAISFTDLDAQGADIVEHIHPDSPNFKPGDSFSSNWIEYDPPADIAGVRCMLRAVSFTDGTEWGTWPAGTFEARHRTIRPVPCGAPMNRPQETIALREPRPGARGVGPNRVHLVFSSAYPLLGRVYELRLVPDAGRVIKLASYDALKQLFEGTANAPPFDGAIDVDGLAPGTSYRVVLDVLDTQKTREHCPAILEVSLGGFTTAR